MGREFKTQFFTNRETDDSRLLNKVLFLINIDNF